MTTRLIRTTRIDDDNQRSGPLGLEKFLGKHADANLSSALEKTAVGADTRVGARRAPSASPRSEVSVVNEDEDEEGDEEHYLHDGIPRTGNDTHEGNVSDIEQRRQRDELAQLGDDAHLAQENARDRRSGDE